ncbi:potassium channel family protein [Methanoregula formicica]|uniref:potassium channel family protein n=1 Tax=Methanoregula formicica TaxID=882104 RepID=UPI0006944B73|nr:potassium channel family protein [Methanoregula formicica]
MKQISFRFRVYIMVFLSVVCLGTLGISLAEGMHPFDAFYFLIVTVATVGYGDIHPGRSRARSSRLPSSPE